MKINLENFTHDYGTVIHFAVATESGRTFRLNNNSGYVIKRWSIDKEVFKESKEERCDFLILIEIEKTKKCMHFYIELKGKDLVKTCRQIKNTIDLVDAFKIVKHEARIITTGTNKIDIRTLDYQKLDLRMRETGKIKSLHQPGN